MYGMDVNRGQGGSLPAPPVAGFQRSATWLAGTHRLGNVPSHRNRRQWYIPLPHLSAPISMLQGKPMPTLSPRATCFHFPIISSPNPSSQHQTPPSHIHFPPPRILSEFKRLRVAAIRTSTPHTSISGTSLSGTWIFAGRHVVSVRPQPLSSSPLPSSVSLGKALGKPCAAGRLHEQAIARIATSSAVPRRRGASPCHPPPRGRPYC